MSDGVKFIFKTLLKVPIIILVTYAIFNAFAFSLSYFKILGFSYVAMQTAVENNYLPTQELNTLTTYLTDLETEMLTINDKAGIQHNYGQYMSETYITFYENGNMDFMGIISGTYQVTGNKVTLKAYGETLDLQIDGDKLLDITEFSADGYFIAESSIVTEKVEPDGKNHTFKAVEVLSKVD